MAAIFYSYTGNDLFKVGGGSSTSPIQSDLFDSLVSSGTMTILTQISATINETVQFFLTFDDFIHYYHFGKGLGSISIQGIIFTSCESGGFPGLDSVWDRVSDNRGKEVTVSFGSVTLTGVIQSINFQVVAEPETMINFSIELGMTNHSMQSPKVSSAC